MHPNIFCITPTVLCVALPYQSTLYTSALSHLIRWIE
jgi:hypothetical protein